MRGGSGEGRQAGATAPAAAERLRWGLPPWGAEIWGAHLSHGAHAGTGGAGGHRAASEEGLGGGGSKRRGHARSVPGGGPMSVMWRK